MRKDEIGVASCWYTAHAASQRQTSTSQGERGLLLDLNAMNLKAVIFIGRYFSNMTNNQTLALLCTCLLNANADSHDTRTSTIYPSSTPRACHGPSPFNQSMHNRRHRLLTVVGPMSVANVELCPLLYARLERALGVLECLPCSLSLASHRVDHASRLRDTYAAVLGARRLRTMVSPFGRVRVAAWRFRDITARHGRSVSSRFLIVTCREAKTALLNWMQNTAPGRLIAFQWEVQADQALWDEAAVLSRACIPE
jgi:hypothetical protein